MDIITIIYYQALQHWNFVIKNMKQSKNKYTSNIT